jgi:hypothetical protein
MSFFLPRTLSYLSEESRIGKSVDFCQTYKNGIKIMGHICVVEF